MTTSELIAALRNTESRSKRELMDMAADTIEALLADLVGMERCELCDLCGHSGEATKCEGTDYLCDDCPHDCICKGCRDSNLFVWRGIHG